MIFLEPIYEFLLAHYAHRINHFALIKLTLFALDKTFVYFLLFAILRLVWLLSVRQRRSIKYEMAVWVFTFYVILLLMLTTFRETYFPWQLTFNFHRNLNQINFILMRETLKLLRGTSPLDFFYNSLGNIIWFIPFGFLWPVVRRRRNDFMVTFITGVLFSVMIETLQFLLQTGVSDIDDVCFNTCGLLIGYGLYALFVKKYTSFREK